MKILLSVILVTVLTSCSSFKASRDSDKESDKLSMSITAKWVAEDTKQAIDAIFAQMQKHKAWRRYLRNNKNPKLFIAEVQNNTSEAYFPIEDMNEELLYKLSETGDFRLVDKSARDKILEEITYQNDGMVDPNQAKQIGKQLGADLMILGSVNMRPHERGGKTLKQYTVNMRITEIETATEILRARHRINKSSDKSSYGW